MSARTKVEERPQGAWRRRRFIQDRRAVTEQVDSVLMIATTLVAAVALVVLISSVDGPAPRVHADFALTVDPGEDDWASGDESVVLRHKGGQPVRAEEVTFILRVGTETWHYSGEALGFQDDRLRVGDTWIRDGLTVPLGTKVSLDIIAKTDSRTGTDSAGGAVLGGTYLEELIFSGSATAVGAAPDLEIVITGTDPKQPYVGGPDVRLVAQVTNMGNAPTPEGVPIMVAFSIDGVPLGTASAPGPLHIGESVTLMSGPWTIHPWTTHGFSQVGIYTGHALVDPDDLIMVLGDANDEDTHRFSVARGTPDPGCAFHDSGDGLYTPGYPVDDAQIWLDGAACDNQGHWVAPPGTGLVIPESVGDIHRVNLFQVSGDANITIRVNLYASAGQIHIKTTNGSLNLDGITIVSGGSIYLEMTKGSPGYGISAVGSTMVAGTYIKVEAKDGWVDLGGADLTTGTQDIDVLARGGVLDAEGARFESGRRIDLESAQEMILKDTALQAATRILFDLGHTSNLLDLSNAQIRDADDTAEVLPSGVEVIGQPAHGDWTY